ncbi:MAG TPA: hypothetical protein PKM63_12475 [Panacibacter sp.]|nr:hypothetical protein [Panacibacter sp.]HNP45096.1 hypothetical protein [Panacibacter sp.]
MSALQQRIAAITENVNEFLFVEIFPQNLEGHEFDYLITDLSHTTIRRGCFKAPKVQIRTSLMPEGHYNFILCKNGETLFQSSFGKSISWQTDHITELLRYFNKE